MIHILYLLVSFALAATSPAPSPAAAPPVKCVCKDASHKDW